MLALLKRLFSKKKPEPVELPPEFLEDPAPDWLAEMKGPETPDGEAFSIRVRLRVAERLAAAEIIVLPREKTAEPRNLTVELTRPEFDPLLVVLGFSFPDDVTDVSGPVEEGIPVTLAVHRREPFETATGSCNLAGWMDARKSGPPVIQIGRILFEIRLRAAPKA